MIRPNELKPSKKLFTQYGLTSSPIHSNCSSLPSSSSHSSSPIDTKTPPDYISFEIFDWNKFSSHKRMGIVHVPTSELYEDGRLVGSLERWFPVQKVKVTAIISSS
jgi:hypothetical protein